MKRNMMRRNLLQSIRNSFGRYVAIGVIIALGAGMFVGLRSTRSDMVATGQIYMDNQNMFDLRLLTTCGWGREQLDEIRKLDGITDAEGLFYMDLMVHRDGEGADSVYRFYSIPERIDQLVLLGGRMPEKEDECLADGFRNGAGVLGKQITVTDGNDADALEKLNCKSFTIVGYVSSPLYMDMNRGNTSVGNGSIANYFFIPGNAFDADYYTEIHVTVPGDYRIYTKEYNDAMSQAADNLEPLLKPLAQQRLETVRKDAEEKYQDGLKEYEDGLKDYQDGKEKAEQELHDAYQELLDAKDTLRSSEEKLRKGETEIPTAKYQLYLNKQKLQSAQKTLTKKQQEAYAQIETASSELSAQYAEAKKNLQTVEDGLSQINAGLVPLDNGISQLQGGISKIDGNIQSLQAAIEGANAAINENNAAIERGEEPTLSAAEVAQLQQQISTCTQQKETLLQERGDLQEQLDGLNAQRAPLAAQKNELEATRSTLLTGIAQIEAGMALLESQKEQAEKEFADAQKQINDGLKQIADAYDQIAYQERLIREGWADLEQGKQDWKDGYQEYKTAKADAKKELADAEEELLEAEEKLLDARKAIDDLVKNDLFVLDRSSNIGYCSLDSSSNIVAGVSKVFPVFFLLVAALVCITTMTRMVDEERTEIGTLKALGYGNWEIISKYLIYAGSSALIGCTSGVILGSILFPIILWEAYKIMIFITPQITLCFDWELCSEVVLLYTAVMLAVTWYSCRRELKDVPAELIRPRAPAAGKSLLLERALFWNKISFLNKVAIRNIFRYRQRLAMMMLGIGGCTALLLTGFGFRDSIMNIVDIQFEEVTKYDIEVYFQSGRTADEEQSVREEMKPYAEDLLFYSQSSAEMDGTGATKDILLITAPEEIVDFIDFHKGKQSVGYPGTNEVLLTSGMADMLNVKVGDHVVLRNPDLEKMELIISGIYDNHVYNYAIISPETMRSQWGRVPENQMAYVRVLDGQSVYEAGAVINGLSGVMNVTVNEQLAEMVGGMMEALNLVVLLIVFCAGLLAAIVIYNLTNINITERIREIATIKVLGFRASETAKYVFKENMVLSVMGSGLGLLLGQLLLRFVIGQIKIDLIWLEPRLTTASYILSILLTLIMTVLVVFVFYFRLEKINMAEALKSVE